MKTLLIGTAVIVLIAWLAGCATDSDGNTRLDGAAVRESIGIVRDAYDTYEHINNPQPMP